jgi:hypothetical protein
VAALARTAIVFLLSLLRNECSTIRGQKPHEIVQNYVVGGLTHIL